MSDDETEPIPMQSLFESGTFSNCILFSPNQTIYIIERNNKGWITINFNNKKIRRKIKTFKSYDDYHQSGKEKITEYINDKGIERWNGFSNHLYKMEQ